MVTLILVLFAAGMFCYCRRSPKIMESNHELTNLLRSANESAVNSARNSHGTEACQAGLVSCCPAGSSGGAADAVSTSQNHSNIAATGENSVVKKQVKRDLFK